ncbi:hypothetical protein BDA99DRAFT_513956 [Phascolomyces articulosus]|uniref:Uncharacterized protein n=1 Tax=Phascolomyces articulosus TaxID=60185 RepID=A0AAD5PD64_9FUNG|nr:hypothetical protein BDA99DRAFT_513956 [Phascolomyces articulosus]
MCCIYFLKKEHKRKFLDSHSLKCLYFGITWLILLAHHILFEPIKRSKLLSKGIIIILDDLFIIFINKIYIRSNKQRNCLHTLSS